MSAAYKGPCVADHGPRSVRIYTAEDRPRLVATIRAADSGDVDQLLRAYGWRKVGQWARSDDMPEGHKVVTVERIDSDPAIEQLERDQESGRLRRLNNTPLLVLAVVAVLLGACGGSGPAVPEWAESYRPCATEDAAGPCYWDASARGDGRGTSFVVEPDGRVTHVSEGGIRLPTWIDVGR